MRWDYDKCKKESIKYKTKTEFQKTSHGAYEFSRRNGFLEEICSHMEITGNKYFRCIYVFEFSNNYAYVGLTYNLSIRKNEHLNDNNCIIFKHIQNTDSSYKIKQLTDYVDVKIAKKLEGEYFEKYKNDGWIMLNKLNYLGILGGNEIIWSKEKCRKIAIKYKYKKDFREKNPSAYIISWRKKWLDDICSHMTKKPNVRTWSSEDDKFLLENYDKGIKYCSEKLNRTKNSIKNRIHKLTF